MMQVDPHVLFINGDINLGWKDELISFFNEYGVRYEITEHVSHGNDYFFKEKIPNVYFKNDETFLMFKMKFL